MNDDNVPSMVHDIDSSGCCSNVPDNIMVQTLTDTNRNKKDYLPPSPQDILEIIETVVVGNSDKLDHLLACNNCSQTGSGEGKMTIRRRRRKKALIC